MSSRITLPGQKQPTVSAWIVSEESPARILLVHHKKFSVWIQPGGHIEPFEDPWEATIREVMEETGVDISNTLQGHIFDSETKDLPPLDFLQVQTIPAWGSDPAHFHVDHQYIVRVPYQEVKLQPDESTQIGWFLAEEIAALKMYDDTRLRIQAILSESNNKETA